MDVKMTLMERKWEFRKAISLIFLFHIFDQLPVPLIVVILMHIVIFLFFPALMCFVLWFGTTGYKKYHSQQYGKISFH